MSQQLYSDQNKLINRIKPEFWILPNHRQFSDFIHKEFSRDAISKSLNKKTKLIKWIDNEQKPINPFDHQWFVSNYLNDNTPYRGLLLYHGLGSGKSGASITIAEGFKNKKIVILTPASYTKRNKKEFTLRIIFNVCNWYLRKGQTL